MEWKALSRCRRLWAAMALSSILRGQSAGDVSRLFECDVKELEDLQRSAKVSYLTDCVSASVYLYMCLSVFVFVYVFMLVCNTVSVLPCVCLYGRVFTFINLWASLLLPSIFTLFPQLFNYVFCCWECVVKCR